MKYLELFDNVANHKIKTKNTNSVFEKTECFIEQIL